MYVESLNVCIYIIFNHEKKKRKEIECHILIKLQKKMVKEEEKESKEELLNENF